ncbi:MAG: SIR2 family protein [Caldilineaceae bacterium]
MTAGTPSLQLPIDLVEYLNRGDCVLFLGDDLPLGYVGAPHSRDELAAALAARYDLPAGLTWPATAQAYLGRFPNNRHGLITFIADCCSGPQVQPGPVHDAIVRIGFRAIVTTWYDDLLEQALRTAGYRVNRVVRDLELLYTGESEREVTVLKLFGCLSDPDSLIFTPREQIRLLSELGQKLQAIISFATLRPLLFVNHDLTDPVLIALYEKASEGVVEHMRRAYAVWPQPTTAMRDAWQGINIEFLAQTPSAFFSKLASRLPNVAPTPRHTIRVQRPPYKFLDYYTADDVAIFCGRDSESQVVMRLVVAHRIFTLFGPSGSGKTSLMLAGVAPRLAAEGYQHVYVRVLDDPLAAVARVVAALVGATPPATPVADLGQWLTATLAPDARLIVILDQFEELFLRVGSAHRRAFFAQLARFGANPTREVRFVLVLREDYLWRLDEARPHLPTLLADSYRLSPLDRADARVTIVEPAARAGVQVETALVDALLGSGRRPGAPAGDLVEANGEVPPAALQIVLDRLYRAALPPGHAPAAPPPPGVHLTLAAYDAIRHRLDDGQELSGARAILAHYVGEALARLPTLPQSDGKTPLGADPALGEAMLKAMVTSDGTKEVQTEADLIDRLEEAGLVNRNDQVDLDLVRNTRQGLEWVRLVRGFERDKEACYELVHDALAAAVAQRMDEEQLQAKLLRELLRRELDNWRADPGC